MRKAVLFVLGVAVMIGVAVPAAAADPICIPSVVLASGPMSGFDPSPRCESGTCPGLDLAIENADLLAKLWSRISSDPVPKIDFRRQVVIATFMGKRPNTSYTTSIDCVSRSLLIGIGRVPINVDITDSNAGIGCTVSPAVVNPYELVVVDRPTNGFGQPTRISVSFEHTTSVNNCDTGGDICVICGPDGGIGEIGQTGPPCCP